MSALYNWAMLPYRIAAVRPFLRNAAPRILDVGCGNHSPAITKRYLPHCTYHGADHRRWNRDAADDRCVDRAFELDLDRPDALAVVPDGAYDVVLCSHVLEHLAAPYEAAAALARKVAPGGVLYLETPSPRSLRLPRAHDGWHGVRGCLSFWDDDSHRAPVDLARVAAALSAAGFAVNGPRPARLWRRVVLLPLYLAAVLAVKRFIPASLLWDVTGFAVGLTAVRGDVDLASPAARAGLREGG